MDEAWKSPGLREAAGLAGAILLACCLTLAVMHLRDLSNIRHLHGVWMALAAYLDQGVFYPPLEDDGFYAGTRYMPLVFVLVSGLNQIVGDYLLAAKLSALLSMAVVLTGVFTAVRPLTGRYSDAVALSALVVAFIGGLSALLAPHADALPVGLALWGLLLIDREPVRAWHVVLAALLFALALATKFSAVAGPAAAAVVLWRRGYWRLALLGAGLFAVLAVLEVMAFDWASDGRFLDNMRSLGSGGMTLQSIFIGPGRLLIVLLRVSPFLLVWPVVLLLLLRRLVAGRVGVWEWYLLATLAVTAVIFTSPGTDFNHLIEMEVACVLVLAATPGVALGYQPPPLQGSRGAPPTDEPRRGAREEPRATPWAGGTPWGMLLVLLVLLFGLWRLVGPPDADAISPRVLAEALPEGEELLCEDPSVDVLLGRRPVVMDPFSFRVLAERGRIDDAPLADRINRQEFAALVMRARIDRPESLCPRHHFGPRVTKAMLRAYSFDRRVRGYYVFRPVGTAVADLGRGGIGGYQRFLRTRMASSAPRQPSAVTVLPSSDL
jgi:hypothetical protein